MSFEAFKGFASLENRQMVGRVLCFSHLMCLFCVGMTKNLVMLSLHVSLEHFLSNLQSSIGRSPEFGTRKPKSRQLKWRMKQV